MGFFKKLYYKPWINYSTNKKQGEDRQRGLFIKFLNVKVNIGRGKYNYFIFSFAYGYSKKYNAFKSFNYNRRFGLWLTTV